MGLPSYMRSVVDRNVVMWRIPVHLPCPNNVRESAQFGYQDVAVEVCIRNSDYGPDGPSNYLG